MRRKNKANQYFNSSHQLLQVIVNTFEGTVFVKDKNGNYQFVNSAFCRDFGIKKNELIGKDDYFVFPREVAAKLQENDKRIMQSKKAETVIERGKGKSKFSTYRTDKIPLIAENGEVYGICSIGFDITQQKKIEKERELLLKKLQKALVEIRTLRGTLPLCSFCKRIRDDNDSWEQVDVYIQQHTEADISHSVCPKCMKKNYPEVYKDMKDFKENHPTIG
jgi:PAS domain S-box-containing protein